MTTWSKEAALAALREAAEETKSLESRRRFSEDHTRWLLRTSTILEEIYGKNSRFYRNFRAYSWSFVGSVFITAELDAFGGPWDPGRTVERKHQEAYVQQLEGARGLLLAAMDHLESRDISDVYEGKDTPPESSAILKIINLAEHRLRKAIRSKPGAEREVQDAFENLLIGADISYSRETERIAYSSKTYTPDFAVPKIDLAIEIKLCNRSEREKEVIAEINDDVLGYQQKFGNLLFVVYDLGWIRDIERFVRSFEEKQNVVVRVVKH